MARSDSGAGNEVVRTSPEARSTNRILLPPKIDTVVTANEDVRSKASPSNPAPRSIGGADPDRPWSTENDASVCPVELSTNTSLPGGAAGSVGESLQAPEETLEKYRGEYLEGWDRVREERLGRQRAMGLVGEGVALSDRPDGIPEWEALSEKKREEMGLRMAIYAAPVADFDRAVGVLVKAL